MPDGSGFDFSFSESLQPSELLAINFVSAKPIDTEIATARLREAFDIPEPPAGQPDLANMKTLLSTATSQIELMYEVGNGDLTILLIDQRRVQLERLETQRHNPALKAAPKF